MENNEDAVLGLKRKRGMDDCEEAFPTFVSRGIKRRKILSVKGR